MGRPHPFHTMGLAQIDTVPAMDSKQQIADDFYANSPIIGKNTLVTMGAIQIVDTS